MPTPHDILSKVTLINMRINNDFQRDHGVKAEEENIIRKLGSANYRRSLGVSRKLEPAIHDFIEGWEKANSKRVTWFTLDGYKQQQLDIQQDI